MNGNRESRGKAVSDAVKSMTMVFQLGLSALCPILLLIIVGLKLDEKYGNGHHWFTVAGVVCGVYSAYRGTYLMIRDGWIRDKDQAPSGEEDTNE